MQRLLFYMLLQVLINNRLFYNYLNGKNLFKNLTPLFYSSITKTLKWFTVKDVNCAIKYEFIFNVNFCWKYSFLFKQIQNKHFKKKYLMSIENNCW